jgi:hypothetical protein
MAGLSDDGGYDPGLYAVEPSALSALGIPPSAFRGHEIVEVGTQRDYEPVPTRRLLVRHLSRTWDSALPHRFVALADVRSTRLRAAETPTWLARLSQPAAGGVATQLRRSASAQGLTVVAAAPPFQGESSSVSHWSVRSWIAASAVALALALVLGAITCAVAAAERREDVRRLMLAGASPRDQRLAAAIGAGSLAVAGSMLVIVALLEMLCVALFAGGEWTFLRVVAPLFPALVLAPGLLALGAGLLARPGGDAGPIGRRPAAAPLLHVSG